VDHLDKSQDLKNPYPEQPRLVRPQAQPSQEEEDLLLQKQALRARAEALEALLQSQGWGVLSDIINGIMMQAAKDADELEGVAVYRAQGKKQALRLLNEIVNSTILTLKEDDA
jgi:hypothetical protein